MVHVLQSEIPTLPLLYKANKLSVVDQSLALYAASSAINAKVGIIRTDITGLELGNGAIVNAANQRLLDGGGVAGAIHRAAGPGLLAECRTLDGASTGQSKITDAYRLPCRKVIHAVGPVYSLASNPHELLRSCYQTSLDLAVKNGLSAIAFAAISTGIYGYPSYHAARVALDTVRRFMETDDGAKLDLVVFCNFEEEDETAYSELASFYFPPPAEESQAADTPMRDAGDSQPVDTTMRAEDDSQTDAPIMEAEVIATVAVDKMVKASDLDTEKPKATEFEDSKSTDESKSKVTESKPTDESKATDKPRATESKATATNEPKEVKTKEVQTSFDGSKTPESADGEWVKL